MQVGARDSGTEALMSTGTVGSQRHPMCVGPAPGPPGLHRGHPSRLDLWGLRILRNPPAPMCEPLPGFLCPRRGAAGREAGEGWESQQRLRTSPPPQRANVQFNNGEHGFRNDFMDMKIIFRAVGPSFRRGLEVEPFESVHVYELMCHLLGIVPEANDGLLSTLLPTLQETSGGPPSTLPPTPQGTSGGPASTLLPTPQGTSGGPASTLLPTSQGTSSAPTGSPSGKELPVHHQAAADSECLHRPDQGASSAAWATFSFPVPDSGNISRP